MKAPSMKTVRLMISGVAALAAVIACGGCAAPEQATVLPPVGPAPLTSTKRVQGIGYLVVNTPIIEPNIEPDTEFYPHTPYAIYDSQGKFYKVVRNHVGAWDETPYLVSLPPGRYTVRAVSEFAGNVVIPVIIRGGRTTVVSFARHEHILAAL